MPIRALTIYQYVVILQYDLVQYNSIHLLQHTDILLRAIYCSVLRVFYELELDHWKVNGLIIGVSVSKPHTDEQYVSRVYMYIYIYIYMLLLFCTSYHKSPPALILRAFLRHLLIQKLCSLLCQLLASSAQ